MPGSELAASLFRDRSARVLAGGALVCAVLFMARLHGLAALVALMSVAAAGVVERYERKALEDARPDQTGVPVEAQPRVHAGVADRQTLVDRLDAEWNHEYYAGQPTALLLISVDAHEQLYAQADALAGDVAMLTLSSALARMLPREADLLARYDESTFAVILSGTDLPGSLRVAARLRWATVRLGIANARTTSGFLTTCMGLAVQHGIDPAGTGALMAAAEGALGEAQRVGYDSLEYVVLGEESPVSAALPQGSASPQASGLSSFQAQGFIPKLPAIRAWTPERAQVMHSPQS
jgi:diguanylate cyclase (GGDEF)-like protein